MRVEIIRHRIGRYLTLSRLVLAGCAGILALQPRIAAEQATRPLAGQWRIFPRAPFAGPADGEITARLRRHVDLVAAQLAPDGADVPPGRLVDSLIAGNARTHLFRLESLLRVYERAFPDLDKYLAAVKEVEDGLGAYLLAVDSLKFAEDKFRARNQTRAAEQETIVKALQKKAERERVVLAKLLERSTLGADLAELRTLVDSSFVGWGRPKDLAHVTRELQRVLTNVRDGRFDFHRLDDIHEFRRRLRWFPILIDSLDGLVLLRADAPGACPVPALEALSGSHAAQHRYSNPPLRFPATRPCTISRCLLWQIVKTVDDLGRVKDEAEGEAAVHAALDEHEVEVASSNAVTREEIARATASRTELYSSRALDSLVAQLSACKP